MPRTMLVHLNVQVPDDVPELDVEAIRAIIEPSLAAGFEYALDTRLDWSITLAEEV